MEILFRFFLIIFSLTIVACKQDTATQNQTKVIPPLLSDSVLLHRADSLYDLAETITDLKKSDSALSLHLQALAIRERLLTNDIRLVNSYYKIGKVYSKDNKFDVTDKYMEKARRIAEAIDAPLPIMNNIYSELAICKTEAKDFPTAISIVQRQLHLIQERDPENKIMIARVYARLATIHYYLNQGKKAIDTWLIAIQLTPNDHAFRGTLYYAISSAYSASKQFNLSLRYINKSIKEDLILGGTESEAIADRYLSKAFTLLDLQKKDSVLYFLHQTLRIRKRIFGEKHSYTWGVKYSLGEYFDKVGNYDSAAWYHHQGLISLIREFNNPDIFSNPKPNVDELNEDLILGLVKKASDLKKSFERDTSKIDRLDQALNTYLLADSVFAGYRKNILHDDPLLQQMEGRAIPYPEILNIISKLFKLKKSNHYLETAFRVMESSRAIVLQNALSRAEATGAGGSSDPLISRENGLKRTRAELLQKINDVNIPQSLRDSLNEALRLTNNRDVDLQEELRKVNPNYFSVRYAKLPTFDDIRKFIGDKNSVYLEYMWSDSTIYILMISPDTIKMSSVPITREFRKAYSGFINEFHSDPEGTIEQERYKNFCHNAFSLYDFLLKNQLDGSHPNAHLIISADGPLATIPFDALITSDPNTDEVNYHLPYLILQHPISYAYSAGVLLKQSAHPREGKKLLAFGYAGGGPARATRSGLTNLPGTEKEIIAIKDVMKNHVNQYKLQGEASESFFKQQVSDFDIVHLALHGEGDTLNALNSRLIFRSDADTVEDGSLYAHELYDLDLGKLDLAVLSACESGVGKQQTGEGVMSIARGFAYAGCPSLVISLWKIDDRTSAQVMKGFYNYLSEGEPLDVSLAKSKLDYIKAASEFNSHPFYWAAFLQVGDVRALDVKKPNRWGWVFGVMVMTLVTFSFYWLFLRPRGKKVRS